MEGRRMNLSPLTLWALAFGCCIGWGSFIMPGTTFLPTAGTAGTALAIFFGALVMILIAYNHHFVMQRNSGAGGVFTFTKEIFGLDHAFFCAWFLWIAYVSLLWANATAVTLMGRNLFGELLQFGFHYTFAGYDVFGGEVAVMLFLLWLFGILFVRASPLAKLLEKISAVVLFFGVVFCFVSAASVATESLTFYFVESVPRLEQIFTIFALIPWAFIGFETISLYTNEFTANAKKSFTIMVAAIICAAIVYMLMTILATLNFPEQFQTSATYLHNLKTLPDIEGVPTFFVVSKTFGGYGLLILGVVISAALVTSLIGYYRAVSTLTVAFAKEKILPAMFISRRNALIFVFITSIAVPFFGRTVVNWLTDVTTIGATIAYGYTSACAYRLACDENNRRAKFTGLIGIICSILFSFFLLIPNLWSIAALEQESYFILAIWGLLGFAYFNFLFKREEKIFGTSSTVWLLMFFLVFFSALMWMRERIHDELAIFIEEVYKLEMREVLLENTMILLIFTLAGLGFLFTIYRRIQRKEMNALAEQKRCAEESSKAKSTFLSNMSHDIRTPMNAIIGYTTLAKRDDTTFAQLKSFMDKIDISGKHLLDLINDILEMSRIESGRMELELAEVDLKKSSTTCRQCFKRKWRLRALIFLSTRRKFVIVSLLVVKSFVEVTDSIFSFRALVSDVRIQAVSFKFAGGRSFNDDFQFF